MRARFVLVGGTGFFGAALTRELRGRGLTVVTIARGTHSTPDIRIDVAGAPELLERVLQPGDTGVYLAGLSPLKRPVGGRRRYREIHLTGLRKALAVAERCGVTRFVQISALGVSRRCGAGYGETKARGTAAVRAARVAGMVAEPSILFGAGSEIIRALALASRFPVVPLPHIMAAIRPIHVADAARRLADALTAGQMPQRLELTGPELLSFNEVATAYLKPRGVRIIALPRSLSRLLVRAVSKARIPGLPAELDAMLAMDNAGQPPPSPHELIAFSRWARERRGRAPRRPP